MALMTSRLTEKGQQHARHLTAGEHAHGQVDLLPQPASADKAHHHRRTHCALPAIDGVGHQFRDGTRQDAIAECRQPATAALHQGMRGTLVDRLEDFRIDLAEHAAVSDGDGQYTRSRPQAHGANEQQCPDDFRHAAQKDQQAPHRHAHQARPPARSAAPGCRAQRQGAAGQKAGGDRQQQRQGHAGGGNGQGLQGRGVQQLEELGIVRRRPEGAGEVGDLLTVFRLQQDPRVQLAQLQPWPQHGQGKQREQQPRQ